MLGLAHLSEPRGRAWPCTAWEAAGTEPDQSFPNLRGYVSWAANVTDKGSSDRWGGGSMVGEV